MLLEADEPTPEPVAEPEEKAEAPKGEAPPEAKAEPVVEEPPTGNAAPKEPTLDEYVANAPPAFKSAIKRAVAADNAYKESIVKALLANTRNKFSADDLNKKEIEELEALSELGRVDVDYTGRGGGPATHGNEKGNPMPQTLDIK